MDIANIRLFNQQIVASRFKTPKDLVQWMGAMQAQDYNMAKWAIGVRVPGSTEKQIEAAIDKGEIIRTHLMRPTWHLVAAEDICWILELTAPRLKAASKSWAKSLGLTDAILKKSNAIMVKALSRGQHLTRDELMAEMVKAKIPTGNYISGHIMFRAELEGIVCSGANKGNKQTYALLEERVLKKRAITRDEALTKLAQRYFTSHGPATLQDFTWWSGLMVADTKKALEMVKRDFVSETIGSQTYWLTNSFSFPKVDKNSTYLLPAFDEFVISYKDRSAALNFDHHKKAFTNNGIFKPLIVMNGQVTGLWKRTIRKDHVIIETEFFKPHNKASMKLIEKAAGLYGHFFNKKVEIKHDR